MSDDQDRDPERRTHDGFARARQYSLFDAILNRRSRRISRGVKAVNAGSLSYKSDQQPLPLDPLEEAILIAMIGQTGRYCPPDRPFQDAQGRNTMGTPNSTFHARAAGSADNQQMTHFFMMNDSGIYYLDHKKALGQPLSLTPESLLAHGETVKRKIADQRLDFPRRYPYYFGTNDLLSNLPGTTVFIPVVDSTRIFVNALMMVLSGPDGRRPFYVDELNGFRPINTGEWLTNGFLNPDIRVPLTNTVRWRADVEALLLLQNLMLTIQALGLGGWIHGSVQGRFLLGHPIHTSEPYRGLRFRWVVPERPSPIGEPDPSSFAQAVGLDGVIECICPPYHASMSAAIDAYLKEKYTSVGGYGDPAAMKAIFKDDLGSRYAAEVPHYTPDAIACAKNLCESVYETYGRFPGPLTTSDAIHAPGIWLQAHHVDSRYYERLFNEGNSDEQRIHDECWHAGSDGHS